jgi:hypothetical protein
VQDCCKGHTASQQLHAGQDLQQQELATPFSRNAFSVVPYCNLTRSTNVHGGNEHQQVEVQGLHND